MDVLRGAAIAGMIVVNDPGTWSAVYPQLLHAEWNGWTYADTIFPLFLFVTGVSLSLSFASRRVRGDSAALGIRHAARRSLILAALGLALNLCALLAFHESRWRFPGVLQRIALCALAAAAIFLVAGARGAAWSAAALLLGYWGLLGTGPLDPEGSLAARVDRAVFGSHTWRPGFDPEGLLSTLPAIATTLLGVLAAERLRSQASRPRRVLELLAAGAVASLAGLAWGRVFPINKSLWTSSYALLTSGLAAMALAVCEALSDAAAWRRATAPLRWLGRNAIAAFTLSSLGAMALIAIRVPGPGGRARSLWTTIYRGAFGRFADPRLGSLLFALTYLAFWIMVFGLLHRKRVFFKI